jgi:hypothetical protein
MAPLNALISFGEICPSNNMVVILVSIFVKVTNILVNPPSGLMNV